MNENQQWERVDLRARTRLFALRIIRLFSVLPNRPEADVIGRQVLRAGTSVGACFREADRAQSDTEFAIKVGDCLRELDVTRYWLVLLVDAEIVPARWLGALQDEGNQLIAILTTTAKKVKCRTR